MGAGIPTSGELPPMPLTDTAIRNARPRGHGFRAVASSALNEAGYRPDVIDRAASPQGTEQDAQRIQPGGIPARAPDDDAAMGDMVDALARGADVVPIRRQAHQLR